MTPTLDGKTYHFESRGLYDGVSVLWDEETESLWHHITGEAVSGPMKGATMPIFNLLQMTVEMALDAYPDIDLALSDRPIREGGTRRSVDRDMKLGELFTGTIAQEDERRPTMEIGVGLWTDDVHVYYPVSAIRDAGKVLIDDLGGEAVAIYLDPSTGAPLAFHTAATSASWEGDELRFDDGTLLREGVLVDADGSPIDVRRPLQLFTRWYGWALMFPDTEIRGN